jgi:hypothetical protein
MESPEEALRERLLRDQSPALKEALADWQGCNTEMESALRTLISLDRDKKIMLSAATILKAFDDVEDIPKGTILWHACPIGSEPDENNVLATSVTLEGAESWARMYCTGGRATIYRLEVDVGVKGLPVRYDEALEAEKEILLCPGLSIYVNQGPKESYSTGNRIVECTVSGGL